MWTLAGKVGDHFMFAGGEIADMQALYATTIECFSFTLGIKVTGDQFVIDLDFD